LTGVRATQGPPALAVPARITPSEDSLTTLGYLMTVIRNELATWPASIYRE
jgi:hypothetical protein